MLRIGIVGSGFGLYGQLPAFRSVKNCKVVCIAGKNTPRLVNYCKSIGLKNIYSDWKVMFKKEKLDAVALAITPQAQYVVAKAAINKGWHVFAEKPLAANLKQASELASLAKQKKVVTAVDFIFPEIEQWQKVKEIIDRGRLGKLKHISAAWNFLSYDLKNQISSWKTDPVAGGGALSFYCSHMLYYLEFFGGRIASVKSQLRYSKQSKNGGEVGVDLLLKFKNGAFGNTGFSCDAVGQNSHQLTFIFERGLVVLGNSGSVTQNFSVKIYEASSVKNLKVKTELGKSQEDERVRIVKKIAARFVKASINKKQMVPSFTEGLRVQRLVEQARNNK